jgi:hypothetical protein
MPDSSLTRFLGGSPAGVAVRLVVLSVVVGVILNLLGLDPFNIVHSIRRLVWWVYDLGWDAIERVWGWFVLGAILVIPIWLIARLFSRRT